MNFIFQISKEVFEATEETKEFYIDYCAEQYAKIWYEDEKEYTGY